MDVDNEPIHELLRLRRSPFAFADRPVEPEKLRAILEAARWAPSCYNEQPWRFLIATRGDADEYERLLGCLAPSNVAWAGRAPVLLLPVARRYFTHNGKENAYAFHDVGLAVENMAIQAVAFGLQMHQIGGYSAERARDLFAIPAEYAPVSAIALGYPGNPEDLPEDLRARELKPRVRKPLSELVFQGRWEVPAPVAGGEG